MKKTQTESFRLVGHLQVTDEPVLSLYVEQDAGALFFFYRLKKDEYFLTPVTRDEVIDYLDYRIGLIQIFDGREDYMYKHRANHQVSSKNFKPLSLENRDIMHQRMRPFDMYDDVFGLDEVQVRHYLTPQK